MSDNHIIYQYSQTQKLKFVAKFFVYSFYSSKQDVDLTGCNVTVSDICFYHPQYKYL